MSPTARKRLKVTASDRRESDGGYLTLCTMDYDITSAMFDNADVRSHKAITPDQRVSYSPSDTLYVTPTPMEPERLAALKNQFIDARIAGYSADRMADLRCETLRERRCYLWGNKPSMAEYLEAVAMDIDSSFQVIYEFPSVWHRVNQIDH